MSEAPRRLSGGELAVVILAAAVGLAILLLATAWFLRVVG